MTQGVTALPAPIAACALRIARLGVTGAPAVGTTNGYVSKSFARLTIGQEVESGTEVTRRNACGDLEVNYKERDLPKRINLGLEMLTYDPEVEEMLTGATLLTKTLATGRTSAADGTTTSGSATISSPTAAFTVYDVGAGVTGTGIPVGTRILQYVSATTVILSAAATATASTIAFTIVPAAISVGTEGPNLGALPADYGVSLEAWVKNVKGSILDPTFPYTKLAFPATYWRVADGPDLENAAQTFSYTGYGVMNTLWADGPFHDWMKVRSSDTAGLLTSGRPMSKHFTNYLPTVQLGYVAVV